MEQTERTCASCAWWKGGVLPEPAKGSRAATRGKPGDCTRNPPFPGGKDLHGQLPGVFPLTHAATTCGEHELANEAETRFADRYPQVITEGVTEDPDPAPETQQKAKGS